MTPSEIARLRLEAQRVSAPRFTRPEELVSWLGAVQAQDYLGALWAVGLRTEMAREADVERALAEGAIVRTWPMRGTLHFVAAADARWMVELLAPRRISGAASRFRQLGLDDATFTRAGRVLEKRLAAGPLTRPRVYDALEQARISTAGQRGIHILWRLAHETRICFGPREGKQPTFVLFDAWLPDARRLPRDEALAELAVRYFRGHGPPRRRTSPGGRGCRSETCAPPSRPPAGVCAGRGRAGRTSGWTLGRPRPGAPASRPCCSRHSTSCSSPSPTAAR
jgi:hypothetical protein